MRRAVGKVEQFVTVDIGVLAYHRIAEPVYDPWQLSVSPKHFDEQLEVLGELGVIERLDAAVARSARSRYGRRRPVFALTFDDGYVDNLTAALPLLEMHDAPATVFIPTGTLDQAWFWWDVLSELAFSAHSKAAQLQEAAVEIGLFGADRRVGEVDDLDTLHGELYASLIRLSPSEIPSVLQELVTRSDLPSPAPSGRPMTTEELLALAAHPLISIGIHTVHHPRLTLLPPEQALAELTGGARRLDELLGHRNRILAYPFGATSPDVAAIVKASGVTRAVTTDARWVGLREDPLHIPRLHPHDVGRDAFGAWIAAS
jgi:peptidoglycan/xylan/chitin deacetylase (PgdA/CDA1 family)